MWSFQTELSEGEVQIERKKCFLDVPLLFIALCFPVPKQRCPLLTENTEYLTKYNLTLTNIQKTKAMTSLKIDVPVYSGLWR